MKLILIRHGETVWNQQRRIQGGSSDPELSDTGKKQAEELADYLKDEKIEVVYSSPLERALYTATKIASRHNLEVHVEQNLREIEVGEMEGTPLDALVTDFSTYLIRYRDGGGAAEMPGGESLIELQQRVWTLINDIVHRHQGTVVIVSHYFVTLSFICRALNMPPEGVKKLRVKPASVSVMNFIDNRLVLSRLNDTCHLE